MSDNANRIIDEDAGITSPAAPEPANRVIDEDASLPPSPNPPAGPLSITVEQIVEGLVTPQERLLIDRATVNATPNTIVVRDSSGNIPGMATGFQTYEFDFTNLSVWVVTHNLHRYPETLILDSDGEEIIPDIEYTSNNVITITHGAPYSGRVILT